MLVIQPERLRSLARTLSTLLCLDHGAIGAAPTAARNPRVPTVPCGTNTRRADSRAINSTRIRISGLMGRANQTSIVGASHSLLAAPLESGCTVTSNTLAPKPPLLARHVSGGARTKFLAAEVRGLGAYSY